MFTFVTKHNDSLHFPPSFTYFLKSIRNILFIRQGYSDDILKSVFHGMKSAKVLNIQEQKVIFTNLRKKKVIYMHIFHSMCINF